MGNEFEKDIDNNTIPDEYQIHSFNDEHSQYGAFPPDNFYELGINEKIPIGDKTEKKIFFITTYKGRKKKRDKINKYDYAHIHNKFSPDNIKRKIQIHYISFLTDYLNFLLEYFEYKEKFFDIDYQYKYKVNKKYDSFLKGISIGELISYKRSPKFSTYNEKHNINVYNKVKNYPVINEILSENYITLFKDVYFQNKTIINLKKYGLNKNILLNTKKVKNFDHLLKENSTDKIDENDEYIKKIISCVKENYLNETSF